MTMGGLFSGIGGFELAAIWAGIRPVWSNEIDPFCCDRLRENFTHQIIERDVKEIKENELEYVDIICGGDPCQPSSVAGLGKGTDDDRYLWPEMFRIIQAVRPIAVLNENVDGTIANGILDLKIDDLESEGYTCQSYIIPAEAVGAAHRRNRVWLVAYNSDRIGAPGASLDVCGKKNQERVQEWNCLQYIGEPVNLWPFNSYSDLERLQEQYDASESAVFQEGLSRYFGFGPAPHGHISMDIAQSGVVRMLNGLPEGMDYPERNKRLATMGNAIAPQVAYEFFRWMKLELESVGG